MSEKFIREPTTRDLLGIFYDCSGSVRAIEPEAVQRARQRLSDARTRTDGEDEDEKDEHTYAMLINLHNGTKHQILPTDWRVWDPRESAFIDMEPKLKIELILLGRVTLTNNATVYAPALVDDMCLVLAWEVKEGLRAPPPKPWDEKYTQIAGDLGPEVELAREIRRLENESLRASFQAAQSFLENTPNESTMPPTAVTMLTFPFGRIQAANMAPTHLSWWYDVAQVIKLAATRKRANDRMFRGYDRLKKFKSMEGEVDPSARLITEAEVDTLLDIREIVDLPYRAAARDVLEVDKADSTDRVSVDAK